MTVRRQIIVDMDAMPQAQEIAEASYQVGGPQAVLALMPDVLPPRCPAINRAEHLNTDTMLQLDRCRLRLGHRFNHYGQRCSKWW